MPPHKKEMSKQQDILRRISAARKAIQQKHRLLKLGREDIDETMNEIFKPLVKPLEQLTSKNMKIVNNSESQSAGKLFPKKEEPFEKPPLMLFDDDVKLTNSARKISLKGDQSYDSPPPPLLDDVDSAGKISSNEDPLFENPPHIPYDAIRPSTSTFEKSLQDEILNQSLDSRNQSTAYDIPDISGDPDEVSYDTDTLAGRYLAQIGTGNWDKWYGVRQLTHNFMIGDSPIFFEDDLIKVKTMKYACTEGLLELLFMKSPNENLISDSDIKIYKTIILTTNGHRKNWKQRGGIRNEKVDKYKNYISKFSTSPYTGKGLPTFMRARRPNIVDYVYWDDPNELVDRLRLLVASQAAGNPSHDNEIISIVEELREAGIIY